MIKNSPVFYKPTENGRYPLVTGASGSIGKEYVKRIAKTTKVFAMVRQKKQLNKFDNFVNVITVYADLNKINSLYKTLKNTSIIYHTAASVSNNPSLTKKETINATRNLLIAANKTGVNHIHLISSIAVYGNQDTKTLNENLAPNPQDYYGRSKLEQEKMIFDKNNKFTASAVRPANVLGPKIILWTHFILKNIHYVPLFLVSQILSRAPFPYVEVENLIDLSIKASQHPKGKNQIFNAVDDNSTWAKVINGYAKKVLGKKTYKQLEISNVFLDTAFISISVLYKMSNSLLLLKIQKYFSKNSPKISGEKAKKLLDHKTRVTLEDSLRLTREYYIKNGIIQKT